MDVFRYEVGGNMSDKKRRISYKTLYLEESKEHQNLCRAVKELRQRQQRTFYRKLVDWFKGLFESAT